MNASTKKMCAVWKWQDIIKGVLTRRAWWAGITDPFSVITCTSAPNPSLKSLSHVSFGTQSELASSRGIVALDGILPGTGGGFGIFVGRLQTGDVGSSKNSTLSAAPSSMRMLKDPPKDSTAADSQEVCKSGDAINY